MLNITFYRNEDGSMTFVTKDGLGRERALTFSLQQALTAPIPSLITLEAEFSYLLSLVEKEISSIEVALKRKKIEVIEDLMRKNTKLSMTAAKDMVYSDDVFYSMNETYNEYAFYSMVLRNIIRSIEQIIEYNYKTSYYDYNASRLSYTEPGSRRDEILRLLNGQDEE
jgi:hypothetical protein